MTNLRLSDSKWNWILEIHCNCFRGGGKQRKLSEQERGTNNSFLSHWLSHSNLGLTGGGKHFYPCSNLNLHFVAVVHMTSLVQDYAKWANSASDWWRKSMSSLIHPRMVSLTDRHGKKRQSADHHHVTFSRLLIGGEKYDVIRSMMS